MERTGPRGPNSAFLLAQLGAHAARRFAALVAALELTPPQVGLLRAIASGPGRSQQELASELGTPPTRLVALMDDLERRGLVERRRNPNDRRLYEVHVSGAGRTMFDEVGRIAANHDTALLAGLDPGEREQLHTLLTRIATHQGLTPGVHPGYRPDTGDPGTPAPGASCP